MDEAGRVVKASEMNEDGDGDFDFEEEDEEEGRGVFKNDDNDGDNEEDEGFPEVKNGGFEDGGLGIDESVLLPPPWEVAK